MAVYFKFKSAKSFNTIPIDGKFISIGNLKDKIFDSKLGRGRDFDLLVTNAQTNQEYTDEYTLIPKDTEVLIRRVPGLPRRTIVVTRENKEKPKLENESKEDETCNNNNSPHKEIDLHDFGEDLCSIPETLSNVQVEDAPITIPIPNKEDEERKLMELINTPALDWQSQPTQGFAGGKNRLQNGFGRKKPHPGYVCRRCKLPGHFIQHCSTNGDPDYDVKIVKPPTGIPKSMLMATPDGSYTLPGGTVAVFQPNEEAFDKEMEGISCTSSVSVDNIPPELLCPLCKVVMKDAVFTSKCCFSSFCDKCIREYVISKSMCICGATNVLADYLLPNKTLRATIIRILESPNNSSSGNSSVTFQVQDPQAKVPSPTQSVPSKGVHNVDAPTQDTKKEISVKPTQSAPLTSSKIHGEPQEKTEKEICIKAKDAPESVKEPSPGEKKEKKKECVPFVDGLVPDQCRMGPYMTWMGPNVYNPYWAMQSGFVDPYYTGGMSHMGYGFVPTQRAFEKDLSKDRECGRGVSRSGDMSSMKSENNAMPPSSSCHYQHKEQSERASSGSTKRAYPSSMRKSNYDHEYSRHSKRTRF